MYRLAILAFAAGCAALQTRPELPRLDWLWGLPLAVLLLAGRPSGPWPARLRRLGILGLALLAGFFYAAWRADLRLAEALHPDWEGRDLALAGRVIGLPEISPRGVSFTLDVVRVTTPGARLPTRLRLGWYAQGKASPPRLPGGDCIHLTVRVQRPHGHLNPGGFDYEAWLLERGVRATGTVRAINGPAGACPGQARALLDRSREWVRGHLARTLAGAPYAGVVGALAVGDQGAVPAAQWALFRQTGTTHLFSVSGLHITLLAALVYGLTRLAWRHFPPLNLRLPAQRAGIALGLLAATLYTLLAGFGIPAQRTLFMLASTAAVAWLDRRASPSRMLAAALLAVLLLDPWAALAPGFWLSFGAVAALLWSGMDPSRQAVWRTWMRAQWAVSLALVPLLLALFHEVSLVSPLANAVAIPAISLVGVPLTLLAAALPWGVLADLAHAVVWGVMWVLQGLAALPRPVFHAAAPGTAALLLGLLGAALLLLPRGFPARWLGPVLCLPLFFPRLPAPAPGEAWLTLLDVGQGEAVLVRTARRVLLLDGGPLFFSGEDAGTRTVAPWLWSQGIDRLDGLVLTHDDLDHSGGVPALLASHRPAWFLTALAGMQATLPGQTGQAILASRPDAIACRAGQAWSWDGVRFSVLHPPAHHYALAGYGDNDRSCVIRVQAAGYSALLTGDIERLAEMNLAERNVLRPTDVLVVPHHGSKTSSTPAFLAGTQPRLALIPVGHRNRHGHPHAEVLARYRRMGATLLRTDRDGAITVRLGKGGLEVDAARANGRRYWHAPR
ncbi:MAG TPA: DNA internalization-related competence protein ComEC/Rec2 [Thiobacillaceae bacterium]|nr:DNA internalization-related competence protein ComEC/Rec2 [Thiobacillaceae bacterium]HNU65172.1 DNA internalization-related competence protein ComEC/Rec2 [Thiobacillaceae bacterium]